jgi:diketogulonate reductase-like aldo/keto reductase
MKLTIQGEAVPALGFGTWPLRGNACVESVAHALAVGYRHIDTAEWYNNEAEVGQGIKKAGVPREEIFLVTKVQPSNFAYKRTLSAVRESFRKLDAGPIDLLLMHWPNPDIPVAETLSALNELQAEGLIRHIGVSNFSPALVQESRRHATIFSNQVEYHPYKNQDALIEQAKAEDYLFVAYSPLAEGAVRNDATLKAIGATHGKSAAQVALRWILQQGLSAIPKAGSNEHRQANWNVFDFTLSAEEMNTIFALRKA